MQLDHNNPHHFFTLSLIRKMTDRIAKGINSEAFDMTQEERLRIGAQIAQACVDVLSEELHLSTKGLNFLIGASIIGTDCPNHSLVESAVLSRITADDDFMADIFKHMDFYLDRLTTHMDRQKALKSALDKSSGETMQELIDHCIETVNEKHPDIVATIALVTGVSLSDVEAAFDRSLQQKAEAEALIEETAPSSTLKH